MEREKVGTEETNWKGVCISPRRERQRLQLFLWWGWRETAGFERDLTEKVKKTERRREGQVDSQSWACTPGGCFAITKLKNPVQEEIDPQRARTHHKNLPERHDSWRLWDHWRRILHLHCPESPRTDHSCYHCWIFLTWKMEYNELMESPFVYTTSFGVLLTSALPEVDVKCQTPTLALWVRPRHPN